MDGNKDIRLLTENGIILLLHFTKSTCWFIAHHTKMFGAFSSTSIYHLNACAVNSLKSIETMFWERRLLLSIQWVLRDIVSVCFSRTCAQLQVALVAFFVTINRRYIPTYLLHSCILLLASWNLQHKKYFVKQRFWIFLRKNLGL